MDRCYLYLEVECLGWWMFWVVRLCEDLLNGNLLLVKEGDIGMMGRRLIEPSFGLFFVFCFLIAHREKVKPLTLTFEQMQNGMVVVKSSTVKVSKFIECGIYYYW